MQASPALLYVETSGLLAGLLEQEAQARSTLGLNLPAVTSTLTLAEAGRALRRAEGARRFPPASISAIRAALLLFERRCALFPISRRVLSAVGSPFPVEPVRTLDA
ncbi:MAG TPA: hypothetical protein VFP94_04555, partial [Terriglobales bacterium]|nr:hypothetical protein [Terriglobales bacterium]